MLRLRASRLDLLAACAQAVLPAQVPVDSYDLHARNGTATHAALARHVRGEPYDTPALALAEGADPDEVGYLVAAGVRCWERLAPYFPRAEPEVELTVHEPLVDLSGHADVLSLRPDGAGEVRILDWKSGYSDESHEHQLRGYAFLACAVHAVETARVCLVHLRARTADWQTYTRAELRGWFDGLVSRLLQPGAYRAGQHCGYCPRAHECAARTALVRQASLALLDGDNVHLAPPAELAGTIYADLLDRARLLERVALSVREQVRAEVIRAGGRLETGDGRVLELVPHERRAIDYVPGRAVLLEALGAEKLAALCQVGKGDVEEAVRARAEKGQKGAAVRQLLADLEEVGALKPETSWRLEVRRALPTVEHKSHGSSAAAK
jgi:PD-(D/E)XK nuclease superfamily